MDSGTSSGLLVCPPVEPQRAGNGGVFFESTLMQGKGRIPPQFVWPQSERAQTLDELVAPVVDLGGFLRGNEDATRRAVEFVTAACRAHGFFLVTNHGVDDDLVRDALGCMGAFFGMPHDQKLRARRQPGTVWGYTGAHADRFASKLPWKETLSFGYRYSGAGTEHAVVAYFTSVLGKDFEQMGLVYQRYCEAMKEISLGIMELLGVSLGIGRGHYREFFEDSNSIMRCNYYPPCPEPELTLGTGPHCDPAALTILHQDDVGGLEVFTDGRWHCVSPVPGTLVVNIGDTFMALSNGRYQSCLHRAVVNRHIERRSLAFFLCPREDKAVRPPADLVLPGGGDIRKYPDFTWLQLLEFTQRNYRADMRTLQSFTEWLHDHDPHHTHDHHN
ncbi:hypothetical protein Taro_053742 [Colocasia esculenta]|uniref:Fe2OG dioxygenase domain-containing protein n=1 Tax=Colocasia esculenta TaxID=4460 RepID=A0A843XNG2_COLES|nr:hypothetical protein [Colocasia esculenta]